MINYPFYSYFADSALYIIKSGVNGHYVGQQPDLSYTSYFQQPGVHKSEALPYHSLASTSVGVQNKSVSGSGFARNDPRRSSTLANQNNSKSAHRNGSLTSRLSKISIDTTKEIEILKKVISWSLWCFRYFTISVGITACCLYIHFVDW